MGWESLYFYRLQVTFQAQEEGLIPKYKGSLLRGALGAALKRISCVRRDGKCVLCSLQSKCVYGVVFESHSNTQADFRKHLNAPRPYLIFPLDRGKRLYRPGDTLIFHFILVGKAISYLPHIVLAFNMMAARGIGSRRVPFQAVAVKELRPDGSSRNIWNNQTEYLRPLSEEARFTSDCVKDPPSGEVLRLKFLTPCRIKSFGRLLNREIPFETLVERLKERLSLLSSFYCGEEETSEERLSLEKARRIKIVENKLRWRDWTRRSSRQGKMKLGGLLGEVTYCGPWQDYFPLLCLGEYLHVGKSTTFGLGHFSIKVKGKSKCLKRK